MEFTEAVDVALTQRYALSPRSQGREPKTPITQTRGLQARMRRLMDKMGGSRRKAAAAAGVPYSTWNHAYKGRNVKPATLEKIAGAFRRIITGPAYALRVKKVGTPDKWLITAVVVADPGDPTKHGSGNGGGSRYVNGHGSGLSRAQAAALSGNENDPGWRTFKAEGLDSGAIVDAWVYGGAAAGADKLLEEIEAAYGTEFGFEGDDVEVTFE